MGETEGQVAGGKADRTRIRFLAPDMCRIHVGKLGALHVTLNDEESIGGVYAAYAFPVAHPDSYISLIQASGDADTEIGVIRDLKGFPTEDADLVREALARRYFVHTITGINRVGWRYGLIRFDVETDKGPVEFFMRWSQNRAVAYGERGKVIIDLENNRYLIPDLDALTTRERQDFQRVIYW